jgi:hypothetical protein
VYRPALIGTIFSSLRWRKDRTMAHPYSCTPALPQGLVFSTPGCLFDLDLCSEIGCMFREDVKRRSVRVRASCARCESAFLTSLLPHNNVTPAIPFGHPFSAVGQPIEHFLPFPYRCGLAHLLQDSRPRCGRPFFASMFTVLRVTSVIRRLHSEPGSWRNRDLTPTDNTFRVADDSETDGPIQRL